MAKIVNKTKVITRPQNPLELCERLGSQEHQRRHAQVQRQPDHPEV